MATATFSHHVALDGDTEVFIEKGDTSYADDHPAVLANPTYFKTDAPAEPKRGPGRPRKDAAPDA